MFIPYILLLVICFVFGDIPDAGQQTEIVNAHNDYRRKENASNMRQMVWNDQLAATASEWANQCHFNHNSPSTANTAFTYIGQNIYVSSLQTPSFTDAINNWFLEKANYNFNTKACSGICGHYTQVVWAKSYAVGCGFKVCSSVAELPGWDGVSLIVCNYGPGGNFRNISPYQAGPSCNACPTNTKCVNNLCA